MDATHHLPPTRDRPDAPPGRDAPWTPVLHTARWRGHDDVVVVTPRTGGPGGPRPTVAQVRACVEGLAHRGVRQVLTGALARAEQEPFLAAGFAVHEHLHLLVHDLAVLPPMPATAARLRPARDADRRPALVIDARAFEPFWRLDQDALDDALAATAAARFRVARHPEVVGYAVTGRAGRRGYLQRLAVDPRHQGQGIGSALVVDGLRWLRRRRVQQVVVNTQVSNHGAFALYQRLGFVPDPDGLTVLTTAPGRAPAGRP